MIPEKDKYRDETHDSESLSNDSESEDLISGFHVPVSSRNNAIFVRLLSFISTCSILFNVLLLVYIKLRWPKNISHFARLPNDEITVPFHYSTEYGSSNEDMEGKDALWNAIDVSEGFVALTHEESDAMGLPRSQTFPWDANKGMYVSHGHHALHCTVLLHAYTYDAHRGRTPLVSYHHIEHCLDLLRQDIICYADDMMDYTPGNGENSLTGENQPRQCRDWNKLRAWVQERSACYKTINITRAGEDHGVKHQLDRYTYCPKGSPYEPLVETYKYLVNVNEGNLDEAGLARLTEADKTAGEMALMEHNHNITSG